MNAYSEEQRFIKSHNRVNNGSAVPGKGFSFNSLTNGERIWSSSNKNSTTRRTAQKKMDFSKCIFTDDESIKHGKIISISCPVLEDDV